GRARDVLVGLELAVEARQREAGHDLDRGERVVAVVGGEGAEGRRGRRGHRGRHLVHVLVDGVGDGLLGGELPRLGPLVEDGVEGGGQSGGGGGQERVLAGHALGPGGGGERRRPGRRPRPGDGALPHAAPAPGRPV